MKRAATIIVLLAVVCAILIMSFLKMRLSQEGQDSWEAVRNYVFRDGQIAVTLTPGSIITNVKCVKSSDVAWKDNRATVRAEYIWDPNIIIDYKTPQGDKRHIVVNTEKINWARVSIIEESTGRFAMYENGVRRDDRRFIVEQ